MYFITMHESISSNINKSKDFRCLTYAIVYDMCMGYGCLTPLAMLFHMQMYIQKILSFICGGNNISVMSWWSVLLE